MTKQNHIGWNFKNSYAQLPEKMFAKQMPTAVPNPKMVCFNDELAKTLGLDFSAISEDNKAQLFSGNLLPIGAEPIAQAYAGHQFGHFTMLGDGRAILLGEHLSPSNKLFDIQLKGSGQTVYSRRGDGKATLRSMLREFLISEAMYHLGVPTSRSLSVVSTGEKVYREEVHEGAVLARVMSSHIRVGTFEYVSNFLDVAILQGFTNYVIKRHYPELAKNANPPLALLKTVMNKQIDLVINWLRIGFIHGVMNTDNMSIAGETFDYGPCAFINNYHPDTVFSSIDVQGRYAFGQQPGIVQWNLVCLAEALIPLIGKDADKAVKMAQEVINSFPAIYKEKWWQMNGIKLGFTSVAENEKQLIEDLLTWMQNNQADYTNTYLAIANYYQQTDEKYIAPDFAQWYQRWEDILKANNISLSSALKTMQQHNPEFIPRNHLVEKSLDNACLQQNFTLFNELLKTSKAPYQAQSSYKHLQTPPPDGDKGYKTFCGT